MLVKVLSFMGYWKLLENLVHNNWFITNNYRGLKSSTSHSSTIKVQIVCKFWISIVIFVVLNTFKTKHIKIHAQTSINLCIYVSMFTPHFFTKILKLFQEKHYMGDIGVLVIFIDNAFKSSIHLVQFFNLPNLFVYDPDLYHSIEL